MTSRDTQRWVIPKGWPKKKMKAYELAALEAYEEAGIEGRVGKQAIGSYHYVKKLKDDTDIWCRVHVFPLRVLYHNVDWPEKDERDFKWVSPMRAALMVQEKELRWLIKAFRPKELQYKRRRLDDTIKSFAKRHVPGL